MVIQDLELAADLTVEPARDENPAPIASLPGNDSCGVFRFMVNSRQARRNRAKLRRRQYNAVKAHNIQASYAENNAASLCFGTSKKIYGSPRRRAPEPLNIPTARQIEVAGYLRLIANAEYDLHVVRTHAAMVDIKVELRALGHYAFITQIREYHFFVCHFCTVPELELPVPCNLHDALKAVIEDVDLQNLIVRSPVAQSEGIVAQASEMTLRSTIESQRPVQETEGSAVSPCRGTTTHVKTTRS